MACQVGGQSHTLLVKKEVMAPRTFDGLAHGTVSSGLIRLVKPEFANVDGPVPTFAFGPGHVVLHLIWRPGFGSLQRTRSHNSPKWSHPRVQPHKGTSTLFCLWPWPGVLPWKSKTYGLRRTRPWTGPQWPLPPPNSAPARSFVPEAGSHGRMLP